MERVDGLARLGLGVGGAFAMTFLPEAKDNTRADDLVIRVRRDAGVEAEGGVLAELRWAKIHPRRLFDSRCF
jgi:hypothetical protein